MLQESPLAESHRRNGAQFGSDAGWSLPLHFGDALQEYWAVRSQVGLVDLCHRALVRFSGPDRVSYLQGMASNDVKILTPGQGCHAAFLNVQGKVLADARIFCAGEFFLVDLWEFLKEKVLSHLNRYLVADDVEITDLTGQHGLVSVQGPKSKELLTELFPHQEIPEGELDHRGLRGGGIEGRLIRSGPAGREGYDMIVSTGDLGVLILRLQEAARSFPLRWVGTQAQEILRIENGVPRYGVDMDDDHLLPETGLDRAVSFTKGCYLGQEVVERVRSRGHVNRKLVGMILEGKLPAAKEDRVRAGDKEAGEITSSAFSPALMRPVALGYVHRDYVEPGSRLSVDRNGIAIPAVVSALPFYRPPA